MMATDNELQRLAAMANQLRPEWPTRSLLTHLRAKHATRPYRDLAVALTWIATDPTSKTPARLAEAGPWWHATSMTEGTGPSQSRMRCPDHDAHHAGHCPECVTAAVPKPDGFHVPPGRPQPQPAPTPAGMDDARRQHLTTQLDTQAAEAAS